MSASWTSRIPAITASAESRASAVVMKTAHDIEAHAKTIAAVDTGYMRSSIHTTQTGALSADVTVGADYGIYVEYGTSKMAAQPFMTPAADQARPGFQSAIRSIYR